MASGLTPVCIKDEAFESALIDGVNGYFFKDDKDYCDIILKVIFALSEVDMIKNVIFDLGGVVLGRDFKRLGEVLGTTFAFISADEAFPEYWSEFDRGTYTRSEVTKMLADDYNLTLEDAHNQVQQLLELLQPIPETEELIKNETKATIRCIPLGWDETPGTCMVTGKPSARRVLFARAY